MILPDAGREKRRRENERTGMSEFNDEYGSAMSLDAKLIARVMAALGVVDEHGTSGLRLVHDARRLWARAKHFLEMGLVPSSTIEMDAMELATYALQLPLRRAKMPDFF